jgi:hypothetical protein
MSESFKPALTRENREYIAAAMAVVDAYALQAADHGMRAPWTQMARANAEMAIIEVALKKLEDKE